MNVLRVATLLTSILLILMSVTSTWLIIDSYQRYGYSWEVTTIIGEESKTHTETIMSLIFFCLGFWFLTFLTLANYIQLRKPSSIGEEVNQQQ